MKTYTHTKDPNAPVLRIETELVTKEERTQLLDWVETHRHHFLELEPKRLILVVNYEEDTPQLVWDLRDRILQSMGLDTISTEAPLMRTFVEVLQPGCVATMHRSAPMSNVIYFDVNILLQKSDEGGDPILGESLLLVKEGAGWKNYETLIPNSNTEVLGEKPRITLTFSRSVPKKYFPTLFVKEKTK